MLMCVADLGHQRHKQLDCMHDMRREEAGEDKDVAVACETEVEQGHALLAVTLELSSTSTFPYWYFDKTYTSGSGDRGRGLPGLAALDATDGADWQ